MDYSKRLFLQHSTKIAVAASALSLLDWLPAYATATSHTPHSFTLAPLPYALDALAPHISAETLALHHGKHHQGYVNNLNGLIPHTPYARLSLVDIILTSAKHPKDVTIFNNAAQAFNHHHYWQSMHPQGGGNPTGEINALIVRDFGSVGNFTERFLEKAITLFGSGWVWLTRNDAGKLQIIASANADNPLIAGHTPLLVMDVWEHAYYVDYRNARADYAKVFLEKLVNWELANTLLT